MVNDCIMLCVDTFVCSFVYGALIHPYILLGIMRHRNVHYSHYCVVLFFSFFFLFLFCVCVQFMKMKFVKEVVVNFYCSDIHHILSC